LLPTTTIGTYDPKKMKHLNNAPRNKKLITKNKKTTKLEQNEKKKKNLHPKKKKRTLTTFATMKK
jgi:hypothetical protein